MAFFEKNRTLLALLLISLIVCYYTYKNNSPVLKTDLKIVIGTLKEKPRIGEQGGEMALDNIIIRINENEKNYLLRNCGYDACEREDILNLNIGDSVKFYIDKNELGGYKESIFEFISLKNYNILLNLDNYNKCFTSYFRNILPIILILFIVLFYRIVINSQLFIRFKSKYLHKKNRLG